MYFFHLLLLGLCLLIPFRFHMQVDDRRHTYPHHHQHDISVYACAVFMGALYIGFQAFVIPWQAGGDASLQPFLSLTTFLCWAYPMCFLCLAALCPGVIHGSPNSLPAPSVRGIRGTILPLPRGWGRITPLSSSFCGSRLVLLDNLVSYLEYLMDSLVADIFVHIDTA